MTMSTSARDEYLTHAKAVVHVNNKAKLVYDNTLCYCKKFKAYGSTKTCYKTSAKLHIIVN